MQLHSIVEFGIGRSAKHLDVMPEVYQCLAEVAHIDALTAAMTLSTV